MLRCICAATLLVTLISVLSACAGPEAQATSLKGTASPIATSVPTAAPSTVPTITPPSAPTTTPEPTAIPNLAQDVFVAGVAVGGLTLEQARAELEQALVPRLGSIEVQAGATKLTVQPEDIDLQIAFDAMLVEAQAAKAGARIALQTVYDESKLHALLEDLAKQIDLPPAITVISSTKTISRSFTITGGMMLDLDAATQALDKRLRDLTGARRVTLELKPVAGAAARPTAEQLQQQIEAMAAEWKGVVGIYVYDLASEQVIAHLNEDSVFSGASVMKVPILLQSYINLPTFTTKQEAALRKMIVESDNLSANTMLAASVGGSGTEDALEGALDMTEMLRGLGLDHTYQYTPYEATQYLNLRGIKIKSGPKVEGPKPYTDADPRLRTTPAEMSRVFLLIHQCSQGQGELLEKFADHLNAARCQEMLGRLEKNADRKRMVAGLPAGTRVAHKSGWIEDMQADVGLVHSPGGDFLLATYIYREIDPKKTYLQDEVAMPVIASFARLVYSYYNPVLIAE